MKGITNLLSLLMLTGCVSFLPKSSANICYSYEKYFSPEREEMKSGQEATRTSMTELFGGPCAGPEPTEQCLSAAPHAVQKATTTRRYMLPQYEMWAGITYIEDHCDSASVAATLRKAVASDAEAQRQIGTLYALRPQLSIHDAGVRVQHDLSRGHLVVDCTAVAGDHEFRAKVATFIAE